MFSSYKLSKNKKEVVSSSPLEKQTQIKALIKALNLKIVAGYTGLESEATILKKEQAEDDNREKRIQKIKGKIKKISNKDKSKALNLKNRILQKEKIIESIGGEIKNLTARKNKAIKLYNKQNGLVEQPKLSKLVENTSEEIVIKEDKKSDEFLELHSKPIGAFYLKGQQEYLKGIYIKQEKSPLERKFKELKAINGQEAVMNEVKERLTTIMLASDNDNYYKVIEQLQNLIMEINATKSEDYQALNDMDVVKLAKKLSTQETLFQKYKEYLLENKKGSGQVEMSPAHQRTRLVMEASMLRVQLNKKVVESVNQKHNARIQQNALMGSNKPNVNDVSRTHVNVAAQYCIAKLEEVDAAVLEKLEKKCIKAGWSLDKQKSLVYKGAQGSILLMSEIEELSYNTYIEVGNRQLSGELELNVEDAQMIAIKPADLQSLKRMLPAFEQDLKKSQPKLVSNYKSTLWLFCLEKALVAVKPEVVGLMKLKASLCGEDKSKLGLRA